MMNKKEKIRVRFAPSPTGYLHVGGLRTALYAYLFAKKNDGIFALRIEDTDRKRYVEGSVEKLIESLRWAGLEYTEGPMVVKESQNNMNVAPSKNYPGIVEVGEYGPYFQSERLEIYKKYALELVEKGRAYYCFCGPERLEELRKEQMAEKKPPMYDRYCLHNISPEEVNQKLKENCSYTIRLKIPKNETIEAEDIIRGKVKFETGLVDDQVLLKSDGFPTYHLAHVVDDHLMNFTHVIRGEEWLPSLPKHLLLFKYLGWEVPKYAHLPLLLNLDKSKLSKRQGDVAVEDYVKNGYLKEALINFVAFLGWNPGAGETQEIFSLKELVDKFELSKVHKAGAVFDIQKLDWLNGQYIKKMDIDELYKSARPFFEEKEFVRKASGEKKSEFYLKKVLEVERDRLLKFTEVGESNRFFFEDIEIEKEMLRWKEMSDEELRQSLEISKLYVGNLEEKYFDIETKDMPNSYNRDNIYTALIYAADQNYKLDNGKTDRGKLLWPLRVALTGEKKSPSPFEVAWVLGKEESIRRIEKALKLI